MARVLLRRADAILRGSIYKHPYLLPAVPVGSNSERACLSVVIIRERVEVSVGGAIINLPESAKNRGSRRTQKEEIKIGFFEELPEHARASHLGSKNGGRLLSSFERDHAAARNTRCVDDAIHWSKLLDDARQYVLHLLRISYVSTENFNPRPILFQLLQTADLLTDFIILFVRAKPTTPTFTRRESRTPDEGESCSSRSRQVFIIHDPDATETASDEINSVLF